MHYLNQGSMIVNTQVFAWLNLSLLIYLIYLIKASIISDIRIDSSLEIGISFSGLMPLDVLMHFERRNFERHVR